MESSAMSSAVPTIPKVSSVHLTLPLSCQVCLGKVKDPVICANQHVFCANCMSQWLEISKSNMCPTCRIPVTDKQPFKPIIGSMDISPTATNKEIKGQLRRTRFEILFQEFEREIKTLEQRIEEFEEENQHIKEINSDLRMRLEFAETKLASSSHGSRQELKNGDTVPQDIGTILKLSSRLQDTINFNNELKSENKKLKKQLQETVEKNESIKEEMEKMSNENNFSVSPRKYTVAALETKVEMYEREIKRLQMALERSDEYIEELKQQPGFSKQFRSSSDVLARSSERSYTGESHSPEPSFIASNSHTSKMDKLASVALGTRIPLLSSSNNQGLAAISPAQGYKNYSISQSESGAVYQLEGKLMENAETLTTPSSTTRSIFEDSSKFPACAKLIELTKVRRDLSDIQPAEIMPVDSSSESSETRHENTDLSENVCDLVASSSAKEEIPSSSCSDKSQNFNSSDPKAGQLSPHGTATKAYSQYNNSPDAALSPSHSKTSNPQAFYRQASPQSPLTQSSAYGPLKTSYPSSVTFQSNELQSNARKSPGYNCTAAKKIKVEEED
ncbi:ORC ubiquitin ligase 1-like isoform X2 [Rhopilema esculentum]|uniref:ORC ubiquitin ligase 1-like isoform X2 n=1 Tax=Rhopilema esculentum TaxID=499914 RepID=UPI0031D19B51